jgi:hypothetical protein
MSKTGKAFENNMRYILIIATVSADDPAEILGVYSLEKADIHIWRTLSINGLLGSVRNCPEGLPSAVIPPYTQYSQRPHKCYTAGLRLRPRQGIRLKYGVLAFHCNMASLEQGDMAFE